MSMAEKNRIMTVKVLRDYKTRRPQYKLVTVFFLQSKMQYKKYRMLLLYTLIFSVMEKKRTWCGVVYCLITFVANVRMRMLLSHNSVTWRANVFYFACSVICAHRR
jgi:hypothetical protein